MKPAVEWTEDDILNLPVGEHEWFEAKGRKTIDFTLSGVKEHEARQTISKEVSALANTGGGVLVLGLEDQKHLSTPRKIDDGGVSLIVKKPDTKSWLENWISTLVDPPLTYFNVYVVTRKGDSSQIGPDQGVFLIVIQDSPDAPHQAIDNTYYIRSASRSRAAAHKIVSDIFNRRKHPLLDVTFRLKMERLERHNFMPTSDMVSRLVATMTNSGRVLAQYVNLFVDVPEAAARIVISDEDTWFYKRVNDDGKWYLREYADNTDSGIVAGNYQRATLYEPILPGLSLSRTIDVPLPVDVWTNAKVWDLEVHWEVFADNAPSRSGSIRIADLRPETD